MNTLSALCLLLGLTSLVTAQEYTVPWFKVAGGGGTSTNEEFAINGTIGQVDAGRVADTNAVFRVQAGFWAIAIQQLGYPSLSISSSGTNAIVSWVTAESGLILQRATDLATPTAWTDTGFAVATNAPTNLVTVPLNPAARQFFRLRRP